MICNFLFYLSVMAARKTVLADLSEIHLHVAGTLSNQPTNKLFQLFQLMVHLTKYFKQYCGCPHKASRTLNRTPIQ